MTKRLGKVEVATRDRLLARPEASCPWQWTARFAAATPGYADIFAVAKATAVDEYRWEFLPSKQRPPSAAMVAVVLMRYSGFLQHRGEFHEWNPSPEERALFMLYLRLDTLGEEYEAATGDRAPGGNVILMPNYCRCPEKGRPGSCR